MRGLSTENDINDIIAASDKLVRCPIVSCIHARRNELGVIYCDIGYSPHCVYEKKDAKPQSKFNTRERRVNRDPKKRLHILCDNYERSRVEE